MLYCLQNSQLYLFTQHIFIQAIMTLYLNCNQTSLIHYFASLRSAVPSISPTLRALQQHFRASCILSSFSYVSPRAISMRLSFGRNCWACLQQYKQQKNIFKISYVWPSPYHARQSLLFTSYKSGRYQIKTTSMTAGQILHGIHAEKFKVS